MEKNKLKEKEKNLKNEQKKYQIIIKLQKINTPKRLYKKIA